MTTPPDPGFPDFQEMLATRLGPEAAAVRHEVYFLSRTGGRLIQALRGLAALVRDAVQLLGPMAGWSHPLAADVVAVATLPGASGWGTLARAVDRLESSGTKVVVVVHPRMVMPSAAGSCGRLPRPAPGALTTAFRTAVAAWRAGCPPEGTSRVMVASTIMRGVLWRSAWRRYLDGWQGVVLLHNDFDMMSAAAAEAVADGRSVCIQHGLPTDEFFPARAGRYIVWGDSSAEAFERRLYPPRRIVRDGTLRSAPSSVAGPLAAGISILSQTHTPIYGIDLRARFLAFVEGMIDAGEGQPIRVLLHPEEARLGHPYRVGPTVTVLRPPHPLLAGSCEPTVTIGFSSTAIIDAARRGHPVIGLDWEPRASRDAHCIGCPPIRTGDPAEAVRIANLLRTSPEALEAHLVRQREWLTRTFAPAGIDLNVLSFPGAPMCAN